MLNYWGSHKEYQSYLLEIILSVFVLMLFIPSLKSPKHIQHNNYRHKQNYNYSRYDNAPFSAVIGHQPVADGTLGRAPRHLRAAAAAAENLQDHIYSPPFHYVPPTNTASPLFTHSLPKKRTP